MPIARNYNCTGPSCPINISTICVPSVLRDNPFSWSILIQPNSSIWKISYLKIYSTMLCYKKKRSEIIRVARQSDFLSYSTHSYINNLIWYFPIGKPLLNNLRTKIGVADQSFKRSFTFSSSSSVQSVGEYIVFALRSRRSKVLTHFPKDENFISHTTVKHYGKESWWDCLFINCVI